MSSHTCISIKQLDYEILIYQVIVDVVGGGGSPHQLSCDRSRANLVTYIFVHICRQQNGTSAEEDNYNADIDGEGTYL